CTTYVGESNIVCYTINPAPVATCSKVDGSCSNNNEASASVSVSSGTSPFTYAWSNGGTTASINGLAAGTYSVIVTDANGCSDDCSVTVTNTPCCNVTNGGQIAGGGSNCGPFDPAAITSASLPTGGLGDLEYVWLWNTQNVVNNGNSGWVEIPNSNSATYDPGLLTETRCFLRCARRSGCTTYVGESNIICFTVNPTIDATASATDVTCDGDNSHECEAVHYQNGSHAVWINTLPGTSTDFKFENNSGNLVEYPDGTARVTGIVYNTSNSSKRWQVDVYLNDKKDWTQWQAAGGSWKGTSSIVGNNYQDWAYYEMDASQSRMIGLGTYAGKELSLQRMAAAPQFRVQVGTAANDKNANYGFSLWFDYSGDYSGHGDFNFDLQNCADHQCNGTATASATGGQSPYTYLWDNGATTASVDGLCAGQYCVTVVDASGCEDQACVTVGDRPVCCDVTEPGSVAGSQENCGAFDPVAFTSVAPATGGSGDIQYQWYSKETETSWTPIPGATSASYDPGMTSVNIQFKRCARRSGCPEYQVCSNVLDITIYSNNIIATCSQSPAACAGASTGSASVAVQGGTAPYTYSWSNGGTSASVNGLAAGTYSVTVTDHNGCTGNCSVVVGEANTLTANCTPTNGTCSNNNLGSATVTASGGTSPFTYVWSNGATSSAISNLTAGSYSVTVTDANGCTATCSTSVSITPCCNVTNGGQIAGGGSNCGPFDPAAITSASSPTGGLGDLEYVWLWNTQNVVNNGNSGWVEIPNSNSATYDPGLLTETRCFLRCARRSGCTEYIGESNIICYTVNPEPVATCSKVDGSCSNNNEASASVSVSGGTAPFTYAWSNGGTTASINGLAAGTYSATVTDANGCSDDCSVTVSVTPCCNVTDPGQIAASQENCGGFDPERFTSVSLPSGGLGDLEYVWLVRTIGGAWSEIPNSDTPEYDAPYTDVSLQYRRCARRSGCTAYIGESNILTVTVNPEPVATCSSVNGTCNNNNQASASVSVSGGTSPFTYAWSNGGTTASINGLAAGSYSVTVTDANGCSDDCSVTVAITPCCNVTNGGQIAGGGSNCGPFDPAAITSASLPTGGLGDLEYVWLWNANNLPLNNGQNGWVEIPNSNSATYDPGLLTETRCFLRCARRSGCTTYVGESNIVCYTVNPAPVATCSKVDGSCSNNNEASASVSVSSGTSPFSYAWSNGGTTASINGLAAGSYSVTVTDANGCSATCSTSVSITPCCNVTNGGTIAGVQENCGPFDPERITSVAPANGGLGGLEYVWLWNANNLPLNNGQNGWVEIPNSNTETYDPGYLTESRCFLRCARRSGCTTYVGESNVICVTVNPDDMVATCTAIDADCNGASTGSASVSTTGGTAPYTVLWSTGATTVSISNLMAGSYSVTVTDANGCTTTCSTTVNEPSDLTATCSKVDGSCSNNNQASVSVSAAGGTAPYSYVWSNGATGSSISGLAAGTYSVTVTDSKGCTESCDKTVNITPCCNVTNGGTIAGVQENCGPFDPAAFTSTSLPTGGLGDLEYVWLSNPNNVPINNGNNGWVEIPNSNSATYDPGMVTATTCYLRCARRSGCTDYVGESNVICVTVNPIPVATCVPTNGTCANDNVASASVSVTGGTAPYSYAWSNGGTTASISNLADGTYSVTVTDVNGCSDDCSVTVSTIPCCDVTDPGTVAGSQEGCGPFDPVAFTSIAPATGGLENIVYQWYQKETETTWMPIPGANGETYDPGMISINSQFKRCARREGCPEFTFCSDILEIEIHPVPQVNCTSISGNCSNGNGASATVNVQGATSPYTFAWSNGETTQTIGNLAEGNYSVIVTDYFGCTADCNVNVTVAGCCNVTNGGTIAGVQENCGPFDPAAITSVAPATGGLGDLEYLWLWNSQNVPVNNGNNGWVEIPNSDNETYDPGMLTESRCFIRCARRSGCDIYIGESNVICITVNPVPVANCTPTNGDCNNNNSASASVSVTGGTSPFSYAWSNGGTTASISGLAAGTYSVTVTDANGCTDDCSVTVSTNPCCDVTDPGTVAGSQEGCGPFDPVAFTSVAPAAGGLGGIEYQWYQKETETTWTPIPGATSETYDPGMISINSQFKRCARREGCPEFTFCSDILEITINPVPTVTCTEVDGNCNNGNLGSVSVSVQGGTGPYTYLWSNNETTASISGLAAGTYSVTVTDQNSCEANCSKIVEVTPCCNVTSGGQIAGAQENCGPFDPVAFTSTSLPAGGLGDLEYVWLTNSQNVPLNNGNNGWVEIPNSNSATYDPGMITETTCFIRCARRDGCTIYPGESNVICVTINENPVASCSSTDSGCNGAGTGTASVSVTGGEAPYTYAWSNGGTTAIISGLTAGTYSVTVTDANGCTDDCTATVGQPSGLSVTCSATDVDCNGNATGTATANPTGGTLPYSYAWSNGGTTASISGLAAGAYDLTITDANGCTATCSSTVSENDALTADATSTNPVCNGATTGTAEVAVGGGDGVYTYAWSNGETTASVSGLAAGAYSVVVTDGNGCEETANVSITEPSELIATCTPVNGDCSNGNAASASVAIDGGVEPYTVLWSTGASTLSINNLQAGSYDLTVTDANGCEVTCTAVVTVTPCCNVTDPGEIAASQDSCGPFNPAPIVSLAPATGGIGPVEYVWLQGNCSTNPNTWAQIPGANGESYDPGMLTETTCFRRCARNQGCTDYIGESNIITITVGPGCCDNVTNGGEIATSQENCGPFDPAVFTSVADPTGGSGNLEYVWLWNSQNVPINNGNNGWVEIPNSNSATYDPGMMTETTCFIRCARRSGCVPYIGESNVICITINPGDLSADCTPVNGNCANGNAASASVNATGGEAPYSYAWSNGGTTASIDNLATGSYSVTVTDANGCTAVCTTAVEVVGCCNVTEPGSIAANQENCGPFDVAELTSVVDPSGGLGALEIVWITRTGTSGPWQEISGAHGLTFDPGIVAATTQFRRCVRRNGCNEFEESNIITITIFPQPEVVCNPTHGDCSNNGMGSVSTSITGGTAPFSYAWSTSTGSAQANGATVADISNLGAGTYSVVVTDANGCATDCSVTITSEPCCNVTDGGEIAGTQENCGPFDPTAITSVVPATGGIGPVEYVWLWNTQNVPNYGNNGWVEIPNSNSDSYDPGYLTESRCFLRCARNVGCTTYIGESNVVCVTVNPVPEVLCTKDDGDCTNDNVASIYAAASAGTEPYTYLWSNGETTSSITNLVAGTYSVTATDANGCEATCSKTVSITPCCNVTDGGQIAASQENCGPFDPAAITSVSPPTGGLGDLEYVWLMNHENVPLNNGNNGWVEIPNSDNESYDPGILTETTCFIRCARRSGCTVYVGESNVVCVTINEAPVATCTPINGDCNNGNIASASVSASGGTEPYSYEWSNGETTASINDIAAGTYSVTVTDANGCTADCSVTVSITPCCNVTNGGEIAGAQENCGPFDPAAITSLTPATGGLGDLEYVWLMNDQNVPLNNGNNGWVEIPNSNSDSYDPGMLTETTCFIRCARRSGCTVYVGESNVVCITVNPALEVECSSVSGDCGNGNVGSASVDVTSGTAPFTYEWSNGGTTASIENLGAGTYTVTVTDANGCMGTCTEEVIVTPCCNVTDPGEIAGTQQNCTAFDPDPITSVAPATGGIGPVEYMWLQGDCNTDPNTWTPISGADGASYDPGMLTETTCFRRCARNNGCEPWVGESNIITITIQNALTIECSSISGDCGNGNVASASVDVIDGVGPYTYEWSNGETTASITGLAEGTYTVTVTDANGCTASCTESVIVTPCCNVTDPGEIAGEQSNCGPFDPTAITSVAPATGGIGPVEYMWLQGDCNTDPNTWTPISGADGASYDPGMLTETTCFRRCARNNGCEPWIGETNIITITVYPAVELTCNGVDGDCTNGNVARAIAHISGGVEPYTIAWSNGGTTATIDSLQAGTYTVTVTDANGCEATCTTSVSVTPCCNVTDGGEIAEDQENCGAFDPNPIVSITPATGGIGPVEYAWYSGHCDEQTNPTAIPVGFSLIVGATGESYDPGMISETTCFIRVARNQGCEEWLGESNMVTITVNSAPALVCSSVDGTCENGNVGSASVTVSGSSSPFSYAWSNGATSASIENLAAGTYTVVVTDGNGCVDSCSTLVEVLPCCNVTDGGEIDGEQQNCGPFDPSEIVSITPATGGIGPVEYAWYSGQCDEQTNPTAIPVGFSLIAGATGESYDPGMLSETTCFIRVARNQGCTDWLGESNIVTITINSAPSLVCSSVDGTCENGNVGSASVNVSGAPSPFSYAWSTGATTASLENLAAGTYTVVVTDGNGCVDSCSTDVEIVPCCNVTHGGEIDGEQENCGPFDPSVITSIVPATGGIGPVVYAWYSGPCSTNSQTIGAPVQEAIPAGFTLIAGADGESYDPGMLSETTCYIRVARNQGCTDWIGESNIITITVNEVPTVDVAITGGVNPTCNGGSVELTATSSTAASYEWSTGETTATISVTETGVFVVTVADGNDCSAVDSIAIEVLPNPEVEIEVAGGNPFCNGDSTQLTANCATAVGYSWSTGATGTSIWVTEAGTYSVEVADSNGCMASTSIEVEVYELPEVEITIDGNNPLCTGDSAMLTAVSQGAISYDWSTGETTQSIWVYAADSYSVTVVNQVGCENSASYEVEEGLTPTIQITGDTVACAGGSIELTAQSTGGESILWSTGATTPSITVTEAGEYCVYTTSVDGCESSDCISIDFNPTPEVVVEVTAGSNPLCPGSEVELTATSATAVDYTWTPSGSGASITVNAAGIYSVEVTDVNGCSASATIEVEEGVVPTVVINGETEFCSGDSVMLTAQTVNGESLTWSTGETTPSIWVSEAGEYCVMTASVDGCEASVCIDIEEAAIPEVFAGNDVDICVGQSTTLTATGGTSGTIYIWYVDGEAIDTAQTIVVAPGLGITEYSVVAINENCSITDEDHVKVWVYDYPVVGFERDPAGDVPFGSDIQFTDTTAGQVTDWMWNFGDGMTSMLQNPDHNYGDPGSYWVTLIASNHGCEDTAVAGLEVKIIIDIPNVFTPNNDGVNDVIWLQGTDLENINMTIYNRWGFSVYASEGRQFSWSGKTSAGEDCEGGTYYYVIQMEYKDGNVSEQTGFFTLIR
ncbi:MAG: gliding motility-associated C-terminal domain-containing protein, partial [Flavobacteriales bacterium]|nr:gliding motility-associated C-terminal domain-containing protein [Flavobacteriales bacterium]